MNESIEMSSVQGLACSFVHTGKSLVPQYWYACKTCTKPNSQGKYTSGCCASCASVCHKDHELVMMYDRFYCDCGYGTMPCDCKLYKAPEPVNLPKEISKKELRLLKYCRFNVKPGIELTELCNRMTRNQQSHFLLTSNPVNLLFPWIDQSSETVIMILRTLHVEEQEVPKLILMEKKQQFMFGQILSKTM